MASNNESKETHIKRHTYYYFDNIVNISDIDLDNILLDQKSYDKTSIYDVTYRTPCGAKPLCFIFHKVSGYIRKNDGTRYLTFFHSDEKKMRKF